LVAGANQASAASSKGTTVVGTVRGSNAPDAASSSTAGRCRRESAREACSVMALFATTGVPAERCPALALTTVAIVEGALVLARADGDIATFDAAVEQLVRLVEH